jgi:hypothetical protein
MTTSDDIINMLKETAPENKSREDFQRRAQATLQDGEALTAIELQDDSQTIIDEALEKIAKGEF